MSSSHGLAALGQAKCRAGGRAPGRGLAWHPGGGLPGTPRQMNPWHPDALSWVMFLG